MRTAYMWSWAVLKERCFLMTLKLLRYDFIYNIFPLNRHIMGIDFAAGCRTSFRWVVEVRTKKQLTYTRPLQYLRANEEVGFFPPWPRHIALLPWDNCQTTGRSEKLELEQVCTSEHCGKQWWKLFLNLRRLLPQHELHPKDLLFHLSFCSFFLYC